MEYKNIILLGNKAYHKDVIISRTDIFKKLCDNKDMYIELYLHDKGYSMATNFENVIGKVSQVVFVDGQIKINWTPYESVRHSWLLGSGLSYNLRCRLMTNDNVATHITNIYLCEVLPADRRRFNSS